MKFQSTLPVWGATWAISSMTLPHWSFQSTLPCGSDLSQARRQDKAWDFNPLPVWERPCSSSLTFSVVIFQSTLPVWGATRLELVRRYSYVIFQSTLPVWGAATLGGHDPDAAGLISIHAPVWGATYKIHVLPPLGMISIHAPRVGSDSRGRAPLLRGPYFQSTLPVWERQNAHGTSLYLADISIHAPRVRSDRCRPSRRRRPGNFNPRSPCGSDLRTGRTPHR